MIAHDPQRIPKELFTRRGIGLPIEVMGFAYASDEADAIAREIGRRAATGLPWHDFAVIYRQNRLSRSVEEAMIRARIPYEIVGDVGFYQRASVKDVLALLSLAAHPNDRQSDEAFRRVANKPARGLGTKALGAIELVAESQGTSLMEAVAHTRLPAKCAAALETFVRTIRAIGEQTGLTIGARLTELVEQTGYLAALRADDSEEAKTHIENLSELIEFADGFRRIEHLMEHAALASAAPGEKGVDRVQLLTMHKAKGLEFRHVFLPAWEANVFPGGMTRDPDEERRLAYVALTRAIEQVTITWCDFRQGGSTMPSGFIDEIPLEHRIGRWNWQTDPAHGQDGAWHRAREEMQALGFDL
ncbi:3'-5' exonuclease [Gluconobacter sp. OJB]|uniref:ATP-dependent helicase n=1 Tax=Gluconobacter sp. OJB TaxID=3145196 RepID=UPI0031F790F0